MSTTKHHREVAKLDRVPLPVEAIRIGMTGWQLLRTLARVVTKLPAGGALPDKVVRAIPQTFADLGPTYVKFGQIIASSPGAFGEPLSREFRSLLDAVPPADTEAVHRLFAEELGDEPQNLFAHFEEKPFASASIAQVHFATLHTGEEVVVKIQRPGIRQRVAADLQILQRFAQLVELAKVGRRLSARDVVADFADNLASELDFRIEGGSMETWVAGLKDSPLGANIKVPEVHWDLTSERVLTMERVQGVRIDDVAAIRKQGFDGTDLVKALLFSTFEGGLRHGLFHGDLHAGNLLVDDQGRIVFLDFGIMGRIGHKERRYLAEILYGFLRRDYRRVAEVHFEAGYVPVKHSVEDFAQALRAVGEKIHGRNAAEISMAHLLGLLFEITALFDMATRTELVLLQKTMVVVEGVSRNLDPKFDMWHSAEPVIREWIERNLGPIGKIEELGKDAVSMLRAAGRVPDLVTRGERLLGEIEAMPRRDAVPAPAPGWGGIRLALWIIALVHVILLFRAY